MHYNASLRHLRVCCIVSKANGVAMRVLDLVCTRVIFLHKVTEHLPVAQRVKQITVDFSTKRFFHPSFLHKHCQ